MATSSLDQDLLKSLLEYNPETGVFTNLPNRKYARHGKPLGSIKRDGYRYITLHKKSYAAHRLAWLYMGGELPSIEIDHIDQNKLNNRFSNLRLATHSENQQNRGLQRNNITGIKGVHWNRSNGRFCVRIKLNGKRYYIGHFLTLDEAAAARLTAELAMHPFSPEHQLSKGES